MTFNEQDLKFNYWVTPKVKDKRKISGNLENVLVDRTVKEEMLYLVNAIIDKYGLNVEAGRIAERVIHFDLPIECRTQLEMADWVYQNRLKRIESQLRNEVTPL